MNDFHKRIDNLSVKKRKLLAFELKKQLEPQDHKVILNHQRIVAYIVPNQEQTLIVDDLKKFLREKLPEYMMPSAFVLLKTLPLTPNGKVDRQSLPNPEQERSELADPFAAPRTPEEKALAQIWSQALGLKQVGIHDNFFTLGGDSILSIQVVAKAHQAGLHLIARQLFQHPTIAELAAVASITQAIQAEQEPITGLLPLTPIQHWFFEQRLPNPHHWNQAVFLEIQQALSLTTLERVVQQLLVHHDVLRLHFTHDESGWQSINASLDQVVPLTGFDLSALPETEQITALEAAIAELQSSLNLSKGPLMRVTLFNLGACQPSYLFIVIHHLVIDGVSWRILLEDLETAYKQLSKGEPHQLAPKTTSFKQWAETLVDYAHSLDLQQEWEYWLAALQKPVSRLPVDFLEGANTVASSRTVLVTLSAEETQALLQKLPTTHRTQINDVLLTALLQAFNQWTGSRLLLVDLEGHGREELFANIDLSRTVGWFTTLFPVLLDSGESFNLEDVLKSVKEQLRTIPNRGIGYGVLRYLSTNPEIARQLRSLPQPEVSFNYLSQVDQALPPASLFKRTHKSSGSARNLQGSRSHLLEINGLVIGGELQVEWTYSEAIHRRTTIERLAQKFVETLQQMITECQPHQVSSYTPSDFTEFKWSQWSQADLDNIIKTIGKS